MYRIAALAGYGYVFIILFWIIFTAFYQGIFYPPQNINGNEDILTYYSNHKGYLGMDHGTKSIMFLIASVIPITLFYFFHSYTLESKMINLIGAIFGFSHFLILSASFMLQAFTAEYALSIYGQSNDAQNFALFLFEWALDGGGLSISLYTLSNIAQMLWIIAHGFLLFIHLKKKIFFSFSLFLVFFLFIGTLINFLSILFASTNTNNINEIINFLFVIWLLYISTLLLNKGNREKKYQ